MAKLGDYTLYELANNCKEKNGCKDCRLSEKVEFSRCWYYECKLNRYLGIRLNPEDWLVNNFLNTEVDLEVNDETD